MSKNLSTITANKTNDTVSRLGCYTTNALAAGVSLLALTRPAAGEVVVTHKTIEIGPYYAGLSPVPVDLNNDGIADVSFGFTSFGQYSERSTFLSLINRPNNAVITQGEGLRKYPLVAALRRGGKVGPSQRFNSGVNAEVQASFYVGHYVSCTGLDGYGHWEGNNPDRFVGVRFQIKGQTHYGWVRLNVRHTSGRPGCSKITASITAFGYETVANEPITIGSSEPAEKAEVGQPVRNPTQKPSLGMLAFGAPGLEFWRREETWQ